MFVAPSKPREKAQIWNIGVSNTNDYVQFKIEIQNLIQEHPASSNAPNGD